MTRYELLDRLADAYVPALGLVWLGACVLSGLRHGPRAGLARLFLGLGAMVFAYGLMWLDARFGFWPRFGLDYSTHAAVALAFATAIMPNWRRARWPVAVSLVAYVLLMLVQRYHTVADIASTTAVLALPLAGLAAWLGGRTMPPGPAADFESVAACSLPHEALLRAYLDRGYVDCYSIRVAARVPHAAYVEAFYTSVPFRLERWLLARVRLPSTDAQAVALATGAAEAFAAWTVAARADRQLLLRDVHGATRSWLMSAPADGGGTRLYFGSAVTALETDPATGGPRLRARYRRLLGFHRLYSRLLLAAARRRLGRRTEAAAPRGSADRGR